MIDGLKVLVVGSGGIGKEILRRFTADGARVAMADYDAAALGDAEIALTVDVRSREAVRACVTGAVEALGGLDVLINAFGTFALCDYPDVDDGIWEDTLAVNLTGVHRCSQAAYPHLIASESGRLINLSSALAFLGSADNAHYATAKAGLVGYTKSVARSMAPHGATANVVVPWITDTPMPRNAMSPERIAGATAMNPMGRLAQPADVANACAYVASRASSFVTGQSIHVNGGFLMP